MTDFWIALSVYLAIGLVFAFEAYKHNWNETMPSYEQPGHLAWLLVWPWHAAFKWLPVFAAWLENTAEDTRNWVDELFDRMIDYKWRRDGKED